MSSPPSLVRCVSLAMCAVVLTLSGVVGVPLEAMPRAAAASAQDLAPPPCQTGQTCVTLPCATAPCPTVEVGPTTNLGATGSAQYVYVNLYDFPTGDTPVVWYCTDTKSLSQGPPLCETSPGPDQLPVFSDGTAFVSFQVQEVENDGGTALAGEVPGDPSDKGAFFCDNGPDLCSVDVFDSGLDGGTVPDTADTAVVPVTFVASSNGCPKGTVVNTESDFGVEGLLTQVAPASCRGSAPAVPVNTADDSVKAVDDLAAGLVQIAFTDDPQAADEQAALTGSGTQYAYIPVAASADVVAFGANQSETTNPFVLYPDPSFELTPDMVAGLISLQDSAPGSADPLAKQSCANPSPGKPATLTPCPAMEALNANAGFLPQSSYWANVRSDNAGVTDQFFSWLCASTDKSVTIDGKSDTEGGTAAQVLEAADWSNPSQNKQCPSGDQFPGLAPTGDWVGASTPAAQGRAVMNELAEVAPSRTAAFATMNWYEAEYYGLDVASLENGAGDFVVPTAASVDAALADATENPSDGALTYDYTSTDPAAYPLPVIVYAVVPTDLPTATAEAVGTELRQILAVTGTPASPDVPGGLLSLPSNLANQANDVVNADFPVPPASSGGSGPGGTGATPGPGATHTTPSWSGGQSAEQGTTVPTTTALGSTTALSTKVTAPAAGREPLATEPARRAAFLGLTAPAGRLLLLVLLGLGVVALIFGPMALAVLRRRRPRPETPT